MLLGSHVLTMVNDKLMYIDCILYVDKLQINYLLTFMRTGLGLGGGSGDSMISWISWRVTFL